MKKLSINDIEINNSSYVDPNGFVFKYNNELLRAIDPTNKSFYLSLFEEGIIQKLSNKFHLIESEITDYSIPEINCDLVIKHREIKPLTYCVEWCPSMLKAAANATLELNMALLDYNCYLQDAYPWNIIFECTRPIFIDFTSIVPIKNQLIWPAYQQFINFFLNPLKLASMGKGNIARLFLYDYINGITLNHLNSNFSMAHILKHPLSSILSHTTERIAEKIQRSHVLKIKMHEAVKKQKLHKDNDLRTKFYKRLLKRLKNINIKVSKTTWKDYYSDFDDKFDAPQKIKVIENILSKFKPESVLDLGSNIGKFSILAANKGAKVISIDSSEHCIEDLFNESCLENYMITPIIGDVLCPTPSFGFLSSQFPSIIERVKCDLVLCLGLMHHLHINGRQSFDRIALLLNELSKQAVIFEYVDFTDDNIHLLDHGREINYSIESVSRSLSKYFKLSYFESDRDSRRIILCEK